MRCLERNKQTVYLARYIGRQEITDEYGRLTGGWEDQYTPPEALRANVSPANGSVSVQHFGLLPEYDKVIALDDTALEIDEQSRFWIGRLPVWNLDGTTDTPCDYVVSRVSKSLNVLAVALKKVPIGA